jgi:hypothetical protein
MGMTDKMMGVGVFFERIRRITGYLVGGLDRFNDGKRAEERDRVKHASMTGQIDDQVDNRGGWCDCAGRVHRDAA